MSLKKASRTKSLSLSDDFSLRVSNKPKLSQVQKKPEDTAKIMKYIDDNIIGKGVAFLGPFGRRKVVYADYSSSGRSLQFLEDYINKEVLPAYGDINCLSAVTGLQSQLYNVEARELVRSAVNATADDEVIFCDNPCERLCYLLCNPSLHSFDSQLNESSSQLSHNHTIHVDDVSTLLGDTQSASPHGNPVLFISTTESLYALKAWTEAGAQIERIAKNKEGYLDLVDLEKRLCRFSESRRPLIGLFSGASRLTGILADDVATTILLHQYGAVSLWDYNAVAMSAPINTNPLLPGSAKDALFFHAKHLIGGVQAPGVLVIKKALVEMCSSFLGDNIETINAVRAGLAIQLKESLGAQIITGRQEKMCKQMLAHIRTIPEIVLLGSSTKTANRMTTLCFLVRHPRGAYLHHKFVIAVLNDVFGIQATAETIIGEVLGIANAQISAYEKLFEADTDELGSLRPGYSRITIPFFMAESEVGFVLEALKMVATEAWKLLPQYEVDNKTGEWRHHSNSLVKERKWLGTIRYTDGRMLFSDRRISGPGAFPQNYSDCLQTARNLFNRARKMAQRSTVADQLILKLGNSEAENLRWYMLSGEAHELLLGHSQNVKCTVPFDPTQLAANETPSLLNLYQRHHSLSALDVKRFKSRSVPVSPIQSTMHRQNTSPTHTPPGSCSPTPNKYPNCASPPIVRFSLGGEVTCCTSFSPPAITNLIASESPRRNRCYSWGSAGINILSPQKQTNLGLVGFGSPKAGTNTNTTAVLTKPRSVSCSSQTDLTDNGNSGDTPIHIHNNNNNSSNVNEMTSSTNSGLNNVFRSCSECTDDLQAYVKEITDELATEIKSEIREVITQVEDVLDNTDSLDYSMVTMNSLSNITSAEDMKRDSVSARDVAEYLKEFSKEMASEVKSEIREAVREMDEKISSDAAHRKSANLGGSDDALDTLPSSPNFYKKLMKQRYSDTSAERRPKSVESDKQRSESFPRPNSTYGWHQQTASCPKTSTPNCPYTGTISKLIDLNSTCSLDSGINMCFNEVDERQKAKQRAPAERTFSTPECTDQEPLAIKATVRSASESNATSPSSPPTTTSHSSDVPQTAISEQSGANKWHHLPKDVWKQAAEALDEYAMIRDGDKILIGISGTGSSLALLHALRQFARARGLQITLGAATVGNSSGIDPRALMLYMRDLAVSYYYEHDVSEEDLLNKLQVVAHRNGFTVIALGHSLDKVANAFLNSLLTEGRLHAPPAHVANKNGSARIIRPLVYVRERVLDEFAQHHNLPSRPSELLVRNSPTNSILKVQETVHPNVPIYNNIKLALKPLLASRLEKVANYKSACTSRE